MDGWINEGHLAIAIFVYHWFNGHEHEGVIFASGLRVRGVLIPADADDRAGVVHIVGIQIFPAVHRGDHFFQAKRMPRLAVLLALPYNKRVACPRENLRGSDRCRSWTA